MTRAALVLLAELAVTVAATAQDPTTRHASEDGKYSLELPAAWKATVRADKTAVLRLAVELPDRVKFPLYVYRLESMRHRHGEMIGERPILMKRQGCSTSRIWSEPLPHVMLLCDAEDGPWASILGYRMIRRMGFRVWIDLDKEKTWAVVREPFLHACLSLQSTEPEWPPPPEGFSTVVKDGFVYMLQPGVSKRAANGLHKLVHDLEKDFVKRFGEPDKSPENAPQIVIYKRREDVPKGGANGTRFVWAEGRIYCRPPPDGDRDARIFLSYDVAALLMVQTMGTRFPGWLYTGYLELLGNDMFTGKDLPWVSADTYTKLPATLPPLADVVKQKSPDRYVCLAYFALFEAGPPKYRNIWKAFLKELRTSGDWDFATKEHLLALDQDALAAAAVKHMRKLKPVR